MAGSIKGLTIEIGADTSKLEAAFRAADNSVKQTQSNLKALNQELKLNPGNTNLLSDKKWALSNEIDNTKKKLEELKKAQQMMDTEGVDKNSEAYRNLQTEIDLTEAKIKDLEKESKNFGSVGAQKVAAVGEKLKGIGGTMSDVGGKMTAGFTVPVVTGAVAAVSAYGDVDKQFNLVKQTMGTTANTAEDFQGLWDQMGESAKNSVFGMTDASDALLAYARQGWTAKQATDMLTPAMSLAAGTGTDLDTVTSGLGNALKAFGANADEAGNYADILAKAQAQANTDTSGLFEAMSVAAPICKTVGWNVKDLATIVDIFGNNSISGSEGANALKTGLARLAAPASDGAKYMDALGLSTGQTYAIFNEDGSMKSMEEVLKNLNGAFSGLTSEEELTAASAIFGKNQMSKWLTLIKTSPSDVHSLRSALDDCSGSADNMANALMEGTGGAIEQMKSTFDVLKVTLGQQLAPAFEPVIKAITNLMNAFINLSPETQQFIMRVVAIVAAIGPLLLVGGKLLVGIGQLMTFAPAVVGAFSAVAGPVGIVIAVIAALIAVGVLLYKNWDTIKAAASTVWEGIKTVITGVWEAIKEAASTIWNGIKDTITTVWDGISSTASTVWNGIKDTVTGVWTAISSAASTAWNTITSVVQVGIQLIQNILSMAVQILLIPWNFIWQNFGTQLTAAWDGFKSIISTALDFISGIISTAWTAISTAAQTAWTAITGVLTTIWTGIQTVATTIFTAISTAIQTIWNTISTVTSTIWGVISGALSTVWTAISTTATTIFTGIQTAINTIWNAVKTVTTTIWNAIKTFLNTLWDGLKTKVTTVFNNIKSFLSTTFNAIKSTATTIWNAIKQAIIKPVEAARDAVHNAIEKMKSFFHFSWSLPPLKLPHISISGSFSLNPPSAPSFGISWYDKGGIFNSPSVIGVGEKRPEFVGALDDLRKIVRDEMNNAAGAQMGQMVSLLSQLVEQNRASGLQAAGAGGDIIIPVYIGQERIDEMVITAQNRNNYRSGGR